MKKRGFSFLPRSLKSKYDWGDVVRASGVYECSVCANFEAFKKGERFSQCQDCINDHRSEDNKWYVTNEFMYFVSKNLNIEFEKLAGIQLHIADAITEYVGTVGFFFVHVIWFLFWVFANIGWFGPKWVFDPFPYGLLTMIVSLEAIFLSTIIMMSQNVAAKKSEMRAEHEYQVNLETEKNVAEILAVVKDVRHEAELKHETIEEIKETVEEIQELHEDEQKEKEHQETIEDFEQHEKTQFEKQEEILENAGIDMIEESAPPIVLEEKEKKRRKKSAADASNKKRASRKRSRTAKTLITFDDEYRKEIVESTENTLKLDTGKKRGRKKK